MTTGDFRWLKPTAFFSLAGMTHTGWALNPVCGSPPCGPQTLVVMSHCQFKRVMDAAAPPTRWAWKWRMKIGDFRWLTPTTLLSLARMTHVVLALSPVCGSPPYGPQILLVSSCLLRGAGRAIPGRLWAQLA